MNKKQMVHHLNTIALYLEIKGENPFKIAAYRRAGLALENDPRSLDEIDDPGKIKGIGKATAQVIAEVAARGESAVLTALEKEIPRGLIDLLRLPGLGGKKIGRLYRELDVCDAASLKTACLQGRVSALEGFGKKTETHILQELDRQQQRSEELPLPDVLDLAEKINRVLQMIPSVGRFSPAGSLRRAKEKMKDLDFVIETADPEQTAADILEKLPIRELVGRGAAKMTVRLDDPNQTSVDFRFATAAAYASMLLHFTGSKEHNVLLRQLAKTRDEKISEYGVVRADGSLCTFASEAAVYHYFGLHDIPPQLREGKDELARAAEGPLSVLRLSDIKGDLHMHSTWSDGAQTVAEMAAAMRAKGYAYACLTDHSHSLRVAGGLSAERLMEQRDEVIRVNRQYDDFTLFAGTEMDILADGSLDYDDSILEKLDFVIASIHSSFAQDQNRIMERLENACRNPYVRLIAHPTGRLLGQRPSYAVDVDALIRLAKETGTALELNANRRRLDLSAAWLEKVQNAGVNIAINTDSHSFKMMDDMKWGVATAIRAGIRPERVINTWPIERFKAFLKAKKHA